MTTSATVAVGGPGDTTDASLLAAAESIGAGLAQAGCVVITGGLGGVMAAASRGAAGAGGLVLGLLPGADGLDANQWVSLSILSGLGQGRNLLVVRSARVVVAVGGSWGTLSEIALAIRMGTPVVSLTGWKIVGPDDTSRDLLIEEASPDAVVTRTLELVRTATQG